MLDADTLHKASFAACILVGMYQGPNLLRWALNAVPARPKDREVRSSNVVDSAVAAKLARRGDAVKPQPAQAASSTGSQVEARPDYDALVDDEMNVHTIEG